MAIIAISLSGTIAHAQEQQLPGWNLSLGLASFYAEQSPKLQPVGSIFGGNTTTTINSFDDKPAQISKTSLVPAFEAVYRDNSGSWTFGRAPTFQFGVVRKQQFPGSEVEIAAGFRTASQYANLYALKTRRKVTRSLEAGTFAKYTQGKPRDLLKFSVSGRYADLRFGDDDTSTSLGRSGQNRSIDAGIGVLIFRFARSINDFKAVGSADSFSGNTNQISAFLPLTPIITHLINPSFTWRVIAILGHKVENRRYQATHPRFNLIRQDEIVATNMIISLGIDRYSFSIFLRNSRGSSNIAFFDTRSHNLGLSVQYAL